MFPRTKYGFSQGSNRYKATITALITEALCLTCLLIVLSSGVGPLSGDVGWLSFAIIDCSKLESKIQNASFRGLPDANDFSKHKDFYALYLWTYCSGLIGDGGRTYKVDFCAKTGRESLYNLYRYWSTWGAQVHKEGTRFYWLEHGPEDLYIAYLVATTLAVAGMAVGHRTIFTHRVSRMTVFLSSLSFASILITATAVQFTYGQLIHRTGELDMRTTSGKYGQTVYILSWLGVGFALASLAIWCHLFTGNVIGRAATLDTKGVDKRYEVGETSGLDSPVLDRGFVTTPVRKRTLHSRVNF